MPLLSAFCASLLLGATILPVDASPLAAERWNKRIVLAFADVPNAQLNTQRINLLADEAGLRERDMLVIEVVGDGVSALFGTLPPGLSAQALRADLAVQPDTAFTLILVGKDGGEKLRRTSPVPLDEIVRLIDAMPMRRSEAGGS